jgi:hypothetical protein
MLIEVDFWVDLKSYTPYLALAFHKLLYEGNLYKFPFLTLFYS